MIKPEFMSRAIELARHGLGFTSPNPMVGAVIVDADDRIIGEGWHRRYGEGHAEVNAVASVADASRLVGATVYVTLEPCSHYGKTPPCAKLLIDSRVGHVVVGCVDPDERVAGRGIAMLREAGIAVTVGVMERECRELNPVFMTAHTERRPWVTLKWAQSVDGFIDGMRDESNRPTRFSTPLTSTLTHRLRSLHDAIMVGRATVDADSPRLDVRLWPGRSPRPVVAASAAALRLDEELLRPERNALFLRDISAGESVDDYLSTLWQEGVTSVLVEGGATLLRSFIDANRWDFARVEIAPFALEAGVSAPTIGRAPIKEISVGQNRLVYYSNNSLFGVKNL